MSLKIRVELSTSSFIHQLLHSVDTVNTAKSVLASLITISHTIDSQ